ncbi:MAG: NAD(+)/NADH kinase [Bacillota bacterium]|nr:NAD(+)/NADH kinase [Bacillota bacterium]
MSGSGFDRVGIITNPDKDPQYKTTDELRGWLTARGCHVRASRSEPKRLGEEHDQTSPDRELAQWAQLVMVLGGDGTLIGTARRTAATGCPLLGINLGHLGFLTEIELSELYPALDEVLAGRYFIDERLMIEVHVVRDGCVRHDLLALNEAVVGKGPFARLIEVKAHVDGLEVASYPSDGLIISTPTGSTAYSLSAGGPVVHPNLDVLLLTPICPHTLYARAISVSADSEVRVEVVPPYREAVLTVDGQQGADVQPGDRVTVRRAPVTARLVRRVGWNFYDVLRRKFQESGMRGEGG